MEIKNEKNKNLKYEFKALVMHFISQYLDVDFDCGWNLFYQSIIKSWFEK